MSQEKIYVYCYKSELLRMSGRKHVKVVKGPMWLDPELIKTFPNKFKPANPPEDVPETPSDVDDDAQVDPPDAGEGEDEIIEPDEDPDAKVDPPSDPLAEALAEMDALEDNKKNLEDYGRKFGIELNRRKSLKNMKKDLTDALTALMSLE
jgi:hypothetical protein